MLILYYSYVIFLDSEIFISIYEQKFLKLLSEEKGSIYDLSKTRKHENYFEDAAFYYINVGDFVLYRNFFLMIASYFSKH